MADFQRRLDFGTRSAHPNLEGMIVSAMAQYPGIYILSSYDQDESIEKLGNAVEAYFRNERFEVERVVPLDAGGGKMYAPENIAQYEAMTGGTVRVPKSTEIKYHLTKHKHLFVPIKPCGPQRRERLAHEDYPITRSAPMEVLTMYFNAKDKGWALNYRNEFLNYMRFRCSASLPTQR